MVWRWISPKGQAANGALTRWNLAQSTLKSLGSPAQCAFPSAWSVCLTLDVIQACCAVKALSDVVRGIDSGGQRSHSYMSCGVHVDA